MRISGLASGMDIDSIVKQLMTAERMPLDKLKQKKQTLEWQRDDYRAMNTLLLDFRTELTQMKLTSKYRVRTTTSTDDTRVTATATGTASQSSVNLSKVSQLATSERMLNGGNVGFKASDTLYNKTSSDNLLWKQGSVESKTLTADGTANPIPIGIDDPNTLKDIDSWSVKVDGKSYKVVTDPTTTINELDDSSVYIDTSGKLLFKSALPKGSTVKVDYIANTKTDTLKLGYNTSSIQLSRGSINTITGGQIKLTRTVKEGEVETPKPELTFTLNSNNEIIDVDGTTILGTLDKESGKITFNDNFKNKADYLPPENPETGKTYNYNIVMEYNQNYTNFSIDTVTSKGNVHENFLIQGNDTINSVTSKVNSSSAGVTMFLDEFSGQMSLTRTETGKYNVNPDGTSKGYDISTDGRLVDNVFLFKYSDADPDPDLYITEGSNAKFEINGITTQRNSNTFTIDGVTFTLKQTFGDVGTADPTASPITINVNNDSNAVYDNIKAFVDKYNELIGKINAKVSEEKYRSYTPLTDAQREQLSDKQQEQWEEKAKSGLLRRDSILTGALSSMRSNFYTPVKNSETDPMYQQLASIGITTTSNFMEGGKLEINEAKLKAATNNNPEAVEALFRSGGDSSTDSEKGIIHRLYDSVNASMDKLKARAGNSFSTNQQFVLGKNLIDVDNQINRFEDRLKDVEDRYYRQFTAMEKAIQQANSQSSYIMQQFSAK